MGKLIPEECQRRGSSRLYCRTIIVCKRSSDDTSLFSVVNDIQSSAATLRNDLTVVSNWDFQWKMIFNPDLTKQVQEVIFSRKFKKLLHPCLSFNETPLKKSTSQKHLGFTLDVKLNFAELIKNITQKISKTMGLWRRFQPILPRSFLLNIYITFIKTQLDFSSTTKLVTPCFMKNSNRFNTISNKKMSNNRSNNRNIIRETLIRVRVRISKIERLV